MKWILLLCMSTIFLMIGCSHSSPELPNALQSTAKEVEKSTQLQLESIQKHSSGTYTLRYLCNEETSLDGARLLAGRIVKTVRQENKADCTEIRYEFCIRFQDNENNPPRQPLISYICVGDDSATYYQTDSITLGKKEIFQEPLEQALTYYLHIESLKRKASSS